jgi:hypothetical protein
LLLLKLKGIESPQPFDIIEIGTDGKYAVSGDQHDRPACTRPRRENSHRRPHRKNFRKAERRDVESKDSYVQPAERTLTLDLRVPDHVAASALLHGNLFLRKEILHECIDLCHMRSPCIGK